MYLTCRNSSARAAYSCLVCSVIQQGADSVEKWSYGGTLGRHHRHSTLFSRLLIVDSVACLRLPSVTMFCSSSLCGAATNDLHTRLHPGDLFYLCRYMHMYICRAMGKHDV